MKKNCIRIILILFSLIFLMNCGRGMKMRMGPDFSRMNLLLSIGTDHVLDKIQATKQQRELVYKIKNQFLEEIKRNSENTKEIKEVILEEWKKDYPDMERLYDLLDKQIEVKKELSRKYEPLILEFHHLLTPEQRITLIESIEEISVF